MQLDCFVQTLSTILPPATAMKGDRIGLQLQSGRTEFSTLFITMDLTEEVAREAIACGAECILTFHPLLFSPLTTLTEEDRVGRIATMLVQHRIAVVVAHTNFDAFPRGTSTLLAEALGLTVQTFLVPDGGCTGFGMGVVCEMTEGLSLDELLQRIADVTHAPLRFTEGKNAMLYRIAIVGGSGMSLVDAALSAKADVFITADVKYHDFHRVRGTMALIDPGHYEMEQFVARGLQEVVQKMPNQPERIVLSKTLPNPVRYYPASHYISKQVEALHK